MRKSVLGEMKDVGRLLALACVVIGLVVIAAGCGGSSGGSASPSAAGAVKQGGVMKVGTAAGSAYYDPALQPGNVTDISLMHQIYEKLVFLGQDFTVQPGLATKWDSPDGKVWTFTLQDGVTFTNGEAFTSADVVYTMDRLRSKKLGSPMAETYANIKSITAPDPLTVVFTLKSVDSEFPASLTDYRTMMLCKSVKDPAKEAVGTGPFMLKSFSAEDRAVLVKNPDYWGTDAAGNKLPYLDEVDYVFSPDAAAQFDGLQGGTLQYIGAITAEQKMAIEGNPQLKTISTKTNYGFELQIRCDQKPGSDARVRQALWLGTDRQTIIDLVAPGIADPGNGTLVGPAYQSYYLDSSPAADTAKAKQLLADAGYAGGLTIKLVTQALDPVPAIATAWQAQMKEIGVSVQIQKVPPDVFYTDKGSDNWYQASFCIVDWGTRAVPFTYFQLALTSTAPWNYSRWKNAEFDDLATQIPLELDAAKRADLYKQAQTILQDQVPMMNFLINTAVAGQAATIDGIALAPDYSQTLFREAHYTE